MITTEHHAIESHPDTNPALIFTGVTKYITSYPTEIDFSKSEKLFLLFDPKSDQFNISMVEDDTIKVPIYNNVDLTFLYKLFQDEKAVVKYKCISYSGYNSYGGTTSFILTFYLDSNVLQEIKPYGFYSDYNTSVLSYSNYYSKPTIQTKLLKAAKNQTITTTLNDPFQLELFEYQKNSIDWMMKLEKMYDLGLNSFELYTNDLKEMILNETKFYISKTNLIYDSSHLEKISDKISYQIRGGILHDEVGLGKTFTMLGLIFNTLPHNRKLTFYPKKLTKKQQKSLEDTQIEIYYTDTGKLKSRATLIICPARLCAQWEDELNKYLKPNSDVRMYTISTVVNYKKMMSNLALLCNADIIFISTNIFTNNNYVKACAEEGNYALNEIYWHRIIFDEGHEVLHTYYSNRRRADKTLYDGILSLSSTYKWICSGTPIPYGDQSLDAILSYLTNQQFDPRYYYKFTQEQLDNILTKYFRFNSKKSVKDQIYIPKIQEKTIFLKQTPLERTVYDNAVGDQLRLIQLCTHMLVSETDAEILGHEVKSLDEVQQKMIKHFDKLINKATIDIADREHKIELRKYELSDAHNEYPKYSDEWKEYCQSCKNRIKYQEDRIKLVEEEITHLKARQKLFTSLNDRIKEITQELCPICYDHIEKVTLTKCSHIFCADCISEYSAGKSSIECPMCRTTLNTSKDIGYDIKSEMTNSDEEDESALVSDYEEHINRWGTKMAYLIKFLQLVIAQDESHRIIIFSQWKKMLELVGTALEQCGIKNVYLKGNIHVMSSNIRRFKRDKNIRVIMLSSETCCSGSNLTEASHIVLLDTVNGEKGEANAIEEQAIGRSARLGQTKSVKVVRLIMKDTIENEYYNQNVGNSFTGEEAVGSAKQLSTMFPTKSEDGSDVVLV